MAKCFIHIGMEKTGSTSIQQALQLNAGLLRRAGVIFPQAGMSRLNHNFLASSYLAEGSERLVRGLPARVRKGEEKQFLDAYRRRLMDEIRQGNDVILSGEHFFRLRADEISSFRQDLMAAGVDDILVIGILRSPTSFYLSLVQQEIKGSSRFPAPADFFVDYAGRVAGWQQHFSCVFLEFGAVSASEQGIVGRVALEASRFLGIDLSLPRRGDAYANDSLSPEEMQIVQDFRSQWYADMDGRLNRPTTRLVRALRKARDKDWRKPVLRAEASALVAERHREEVAALFALTGIAFDVPATRPHNTVIDPVLVWEVVANFDHSLYEQLTFRVGPRRYADFRSKLKYLARRLGLRRQEKKS